MTTSDMRARLCEDCMKLGIITQTSNPHKGLLHRGTMPLSPDKLKKELYRCSECDTLWIRHTDKWGQAGTFRLLSRNNL